jgi:hypothetical protein
VPGRTLFANRKDEDDFGLEDLVQEYPWALRTKELIAMVWDGFVASSMSFSALQLDRQTWLYFELTDSEDDFLYLLAVVRTAGPQDAHKRFLREIFRSNGRTFNAEFLVSPPTEVASTFSSALLAECFVAAADVAVKKGYTSRDDFWEEVRSVVTQHEPDCRALSQADLRTNSGRVLLMKSYLAIVMRRSKKRS